jgi:type I restriction enzyme S subunit
MPNFGKNGYGLQNGNLGIVKMSTYTCPKCARVFKRKSGYDDHVSKKNDCAQNTALNVVIETKVKEAVRAIQPKSEITKENLPSFFEDLHYLLWNRAGLNPERALDHMTFFFAYRLIEQQADALSLPQECRWSYIASIPNENDLFETIKRGVQHFRKNKKSVTYPFFRPHEIQKADIVFEIVRHINRISLATLNETDMLGDIFEYMLSRGMSTMADEGQYFTNRQICKLAFKLAYDIKKTVRRTDGTLCTFADWFCGTGGFPAEYIKGVESILPKIDWKKERNAIYCQDMNLSSVTTTLLNLLILTGIPFSGDTIRNSNSFSDPITLGSDAPFPGIGIDYEFMNPPYGGDKGKGKEYKFAYSKKVKAEDGTSTKKFFVNADIQSIGIEDDDKVSAGVQLAMATLSTEGGVCCIVLPQGFFFGASKKAVDLRKKIAEEYKIHYIVDIASGAFVNTGTKTSMLVFQRGVGPTETVKFIDSTEKVLAEAKLEDLQAKNYSLNYKQYLARDVAEVEGFEMVKLGEIASVNTGKNKTPDDKKGTLYPYYGTSGIAGYTDHFLEDGEYILTARNGTIGNTFLITGKSYPSDHMFSVRTGEKCMLKYLYYWMISNKEKMEILANTTTIPGITKSALVDILIPLPSLETQQQIVEAIDGWTQLAHQEEQNLKLLEKQMMFEVKEVGKNSQRVRLGDLCEFKRGKMITKKDLIQGEFPVIGGGLTPMGYHNLSNREAYTPLISQSGENAGHISRYPVPVWASDCFSVSSERMTKDFLYYSLLHIQDEINFLKTGTAQPHVYPSSIEGLNIPVPDIDKQEKLQVEFDEIHHKSKKITHYKQKARDAIERLIPV